MGSKLSRAPTLIRGKNFDAELQLPQELEASRSTDAFKVSHTQWEKRLIGAFQVSFVQRELALFE